MANYEKTRWFLVLRLERPHRNELNRLLRICNLVSTQHGQPPLYEIPISELSPPAKRMKIDASQGPNPKQSGGNKASVPVDDDYNFDPPQGSNPKKAGGDKAPVPINTNSKPDPPQEPNPEKSARKKAPAPIDDKFHVSIAWTLTPPDQAMLDLTQEIAKPRIQEVEKLHIDVGGIKVKIGNIVTRVELLDKAKVEASILYL